MMINLTAVELIENIKNKRISPVEVMKAFIHRVEKFNPKLNAFVTLNERAIEEAKKVETSLMNNENVGCLYGLPIAIKDLTPTKDIRTTYGSLLFQNHFPKYEPTFLKRIKKEDGIVIGKTNTSEFGHKGLTDNLLFGVTKNPWDSSFTSGGSSGGSAVAIATKLAPLAEGSDGGGSIRIPASMTGVAGFKPTYGIIPYNSNPDNLFGSQSPFIHNGPIARSISDISLLYSAMKGYEKNHPYSILDMDGEVNSIYKNIKNIKIAYTLNFGIYKVDRQVEKVIRSSVENIRSLGFNIEEVNIDFNLTLRDITQTFINMWAVKYATNYESIYNENSKDLSESLIRIINYGEKLNAIDYRKNEFKRTIIWRGVQSILNNYDLLLSPTLAIPSFEHHLDGPSKINGEKINEANDWMMTQIYNMTSHPALSLPVGLAESGNIPIGLQIAGNRFAEMLILNFSKIYEENFKTYIDPPMLR